jgi:superfamily I DNA and/or RNA helicase
MVRIFSNQKDYLGEYTIGRVKQLTKTSILVELEEDEPSDWISFGKIGVDIFFDRYSYEKAISILDKISKQEEGAFIPLRNSIIKDENYVDKTISYENSFLNNSQTKAILNSLQSRISIIQGPPGTGKSETIVQLSKELLRLQKKILIIAPSNQAIDNIVSKLNQVSIDSIRVGVKERIRNDVRENFLEEKIKSHTDYKLYKETLLSIQQTQKEISRYKRKFTKEDRIDRENNRKLLKESKTLLIKLEKQIAFDLLNSQKIICSTIMGFVNSVYYTQEFDHLIVDEASQTLEPFLWLAISKSKNLTLVGDIYQLPPLVKSLEAEELEISLLEKLSSRESIQISFLDTQYRMKKNLISFSNEYFYSNQIKTDSSCEKLPNLFEEDFIFVDTTGSDAEEELDKFKSSYLNKMEANFILEYINKISELTESNLEVGVLSPYSAQVEYLQSIINGKYKFNLQINSIDSFQGSEKDIILISLVRSNINYEIGFLKEYKRINVALTRAKSHLLIVGDATTLSQDNFYKKLISKSNYKSIYEY